jgi:hypothetical protein
VQGAQHDKITQQLRRPTHLPRHDVEPRPFPGTGKPEPHQERLGQRIPESGPVGQRLGGAMDGDDDRRPLDAIWQYR